ncbi:RNA-directed DNA polymerase [Ancylomarina sp. YFZ004]
MYNPKERLICAASFPERVLHHALMNICHSVFEKQQIFHSYATRINKGTYAALHQAAINHKKHLFYLKLDVRKYFASINYMVLKDMLQRKYKDMLLLAIFEQIIDSYCINVGKGLLIGNLTSQYFANYYLSFADRYILQQLKISAYVRYMDDMVLWSNNKADLLNASKSVIFYLEKELDLSLKTFVLNTNKHGLSFLGYRLYLNKTTLTHSSKKRFVSKTKLYEYKFKKNIWSQTEYQQHILPLLAFVYHADTKALRSELFHNLG